MICLEDQDIIIDFPLGYLRLQHSVQDSLAIFAPDLDDMGALVVLSKVFR